MHCVADLRRSRGLPARPLVRRENGPGIDPLRTKTVCSYRANYLRSLAHPEEFESSACGLEV